MTAPEIEIYATSTQRFTEDDVNGLLLWAAQYRVADVKFQTDKRVFVKRYGRTQPGTRYPLDSADMDAVIRRLYGDQTKVLLSEKRDLNVRYEIMPTRDKRYRFRVNFTGVLSKGRNGVSVVLRVMPGDPPTFEQLGVEPEIIEHWYPRAGLVQITGPTGSGKTTLLAAGIRHLVTELKIGHVVTYEDPAEYGFDDVESDGGFVSQTEIGNHLQSFHDGIANAMRRSPDAIVPGETRTPESIDAMILAAQTGHPVYATTHTNGVAETMKRNVGVFPPEQRPQIAYDLADMMRLVVSQVLVRRVTPREDGEERVALREWLHFDDEVRDTLMADHDSNRWTGVLRDFVAKKGRSFGQSATLAFRQGLISPQVCTRWGGTP